MPPHFTDPGGKAVAPAAMPICDNLLEAIRDQALTLRDGCTLTAAEGITLITALPHLLDELIAHRATLRAATASNVIPLRGTVS